MRVDCVSCQTENYKFINMQITSGVSSSFHFQVVHSCLQGTNFTLIIQQLLLYCAGATPGSVSQPQLAFISLSDYPKPTRHLQSLYHLENYRIKYTATFPPPNEKRAKDRKMEIKRQTSTLSQCSCY